MIGMILLIVLSFLDTILTYEWAKRWLKVNPMMDPRKFEANGFIIACWKKMGLGVGSVVSGIVLLVAQYAIASIHTITFYIIMAILVWANLNHIRNILITKDR